jgi:glycyl-tRNA synthetase
LRKYIQLAKIGKKLYHAKYMYKPSLEELATFCKRRGFIYQSSGIYGGLQGFFDYGPLGVEMKNNIKNAWLKDNVYMQDNVFLIDSSIVLHKSVLKFSGHSDTFSDKLIDCKNCKMRFRDDEIVNKTCKYCKSTNLSEPRDFNLMMEVNLGPTNSSQGILRPETAQGIFINFKNIQDSFSPKLPFGIAQVGKAFRNEITPRNFVFRVREFEQMELEFFFDPKIQDEKEVFDKMVQMRINWWHKIGVTNIQTLQQPKEELSHYSKATTDIQFEFPHGLEELEGIANRGDFDLASHTKMQSEFEIKSQVKKNDESVDKLCYINQGNSFIPNLIESSAGLDRAFLAVLTSAYTKEVIANGEERIVLKVHPGIAPIKAAIVPLAKNNSDIVAFAEQIFRNLKNDGVFPVVLEAGGNIGKCYRKHDEIGTPFVLTVDFESLNEEKDTVTIRNRDTMEQTRIHISEISKFLLEKIKI